MRRRLLYLVLVWSFLWGVLPVQAQESSPDLELLAIELWPDYDDARVLVLFTGTLNAAAALPATLTLPLPPGADVHAVARISADNVMVDDIAFEVNEESVTLTTPDSRFRVEYYLPYEADGEERTFEATWTFPFGITSAVLDVQQPAAATDFTVSPAAPNIVTGADGLTYHRSPGRTVVAGQPLQVAINYSLPGGQLTQSLLQQNTPATESEPVVTTEPAASPTSSSNLPLILAGIGGLIISGTLIWQGLRERSQQQEKKKQGIRRTTRPAHGAGPKRTAPSVPANGETAQFCHECGREAHAEDRFCRHCGTPLKGR